jgi:integrase
VPVLTVQKILRHSNVATTMKYYIKTRKRAVAAGMDRMEEEIRKVETLHLEPEIQKTERPN